MLWYVLAYLKGIQDVGVFVSAVVSILIFLGQTVLVLSVMSCNGGLWSPPQRACTEHVLGHQCVLTLRVIKSGLIWTSPCALFWGGDHRPPL